MDCSNETFTCLACGYKYDPTVGDPASGIPAGTHFHDLPGDWLCPLCGIGKVFFEKEKK